MERNGPFGPFLLGKKHLLEAAEFRHSLVCPVRRCGEFVASLIYRDDGSSDAFFGQEQHQAVWRDVSCQAILVERYRNLNGLIINCHRLATAVRCRR